jgi:antitoxin component YwqK of YwqJK toxin-antitoxin module
LRGCHFIKNDLLGRTLQEAVRLSDNRKNNMTIFIKALLILLLTFNLSGCVDATQQLIDRITAYITSTYNPSMFENKNGKVFLIDDDEPFTGKMVENYKNGQQKLYIEYINGLISGPWNEWYENGNEKITGVFVEGSGTIKHFDIDGTRTMESHYEKGKLETIKEYSPVGQLLGVAGKLGIPLDTEYKLEATLEGNSKTECKHLAKKFLRHPEQFLDNWAAIKEKHAFKSEHVSLVYNYQNGNICATFPLNNGLLHGGHYLYLPDGVLLKYVRYREGEIYGEFATYIEKAGECYVGSNTSGAAGGRWHGTCNRIND